MKYCSVLDCNSNTSNKLTFHKVKKEWQTLVKWKGDSGCYICKFHFNPSSYCQNSKRLKKDAKPRYFHCNSVAPTCVEVIKGDHNYCESPSVMKRKYEDSLETAEKCRKRFYASQKELAKVKKEKASLQDELQKAIQGFSLPKKESSDLHQLASDIPRDLFTRMTASSCPKSYPASIRSFALQLHLHSPGAYRLNIFQKK